jgi:transposase
MIDFETYCRIKKLSDEGFSITKIAHTLGLTRHTVTRWSDTPRFRPRQGGSRPSKLDPFKGEIQRLLEKYDYTAAQIVIKLKELGFAGGSTIVSEYVAKVRPRSGPAFLTLCFAPGECAQIDWGQFGTVSCGTTRRKLSFFLMVLCYSRMLYLEFTVRQTAEHFYQCLSNAFSYFGGVPQKVMFDNAKCAVLSHILGRAPVFNPRYLDCAAHYGFTPIACAPRKGNEKGRVENGVGYVKKNMLAGLEISSFAGLGPEAIRWRDEVANVRLHGETRRRPVDLFPEEKRLLQPLPAALYDVGTISDVRACRQFRIRLDSNRYSVPAKYAGKKLTLKAYPDFLCFYSEQEGLIARHLRSYDRNQDISDREHDKALLTRRKRARDQHLLKIFLSLSPEAQLYYAGLSERRFHAMPHVEKIVALTEIYGVDVVARVMRDALEFQAFSAEYVANVCEARLRLLPQPQPLMLTRNSDLLELDLPHPDLSVYEKEDQR